MEDKMLKKISRNIFRVISQNILKVILIIFFIILQFIVLNGIYDYTKVIYTYNPIYLTIAILLYMFAIVFIYKKIIPKIVKYKMIVYLLFGVFTALCLFTGLYFKLNPTWDMGTVFNIAKEYVTTGTITDPYLYRFPNNIMLTFIEIIAFKMFYVLGFQDFLTIVTVINSLLVACSGILMYYNTKRIFDESKALMILFITCITTPLYLYCACYYSDTMTMFTAMLMIYLFLKINEKEKFKSTIIWQVFLAITIFVGIKVKITSFFPCIALVVYKILNWKFNVRKDLKKCCIVIPLIIILLVIFNIVIEPKFIPEEELTDVHKIPTEHWVMMGLNGNGCYSESEFGYTQSFATLQERKNATRKVIKERIISLYKENTLFKHIKEKLAFAWYDGSYYIPDKLGRKPVKKGVLHEIVLESGNKTSIYKYWPQTMHFSMLIFICINIYRIIIKKDWYAKDNILFITIFGLMVFLLIWENRSRYLVTLLPIIMMSQLGGIEYLARKDEKNEKDISNNTNVL